MTRRLPFLLSLLALLASPLALGAVWHQHAQQTFGAVNGLPDSALDPRPSGLAVNVALEHYADLEPVFNHLTPFEWLRQTFVWAEIEPERGQYQWAQSDRIVNAAIAHHKKLIAVLNFAPDWARPADSEPSTPPRASADLAAFASAFAGHYADHIDVYQVWDEPNLLSGWGGQAPSATSYAALLQAAYTALHAADDHATVLSAALAPTVETGPDNLSDLIYLQQLYDLGAQHYFDAAAGKPYGFYTDATDRLADPQILNFSRFVLLRQVMEQNGDAHKLLWASNFGWNTRVSPWGMTIAEGQRDNTLAAYQRAQTEWPWAGPLALEAYQFPALSSEQPQWGFALVDPTGQPSLLLHSLAAPDVAAPPGNYAADHPALRYLGAWEFSELGADIPENYEAAQIQLTFRGSDLALRVRRADYRAHLYVEIDGQPANLLPRDERGAYLILTAPELMPEVVSVPVASGLAPEAEHVAVISPERGWDQWALVGFSVGRAFPDQQFVLTLAGTAFVLVISAFGLWYFGRGLEWPTVGQRIRAVWQRLGAWGQVGVTAVVGGLLYLATWLTWGEELTILSRRSGDNLPIALTALTAGVFYFSPSLLLALVALVVLFALFYLRLDLALTFCAFFIPFYLQPRPLWERGFSLIEITTLLTLMAWLVTLLNPHSETRAALRWPSASFNLPLVFLGVTAALSAFMADFPGVAWREWRVVILEPLLFYALLRLVPLDDKAIWRIVDFWVLGAVVVAFIGLYQYVSGSYLITAEGGVERIRGVYGSPNNLALYLGRVLPITLSLVVFKLASILKVFTPPASLLSLLSRPRLYFLASLPLSLALLLSFSKGALFLGLPAALAVILIGWQGRRGWAVVGVSAVAGLAALPLLSRIPRFADLLNPATGTSFFRLKVWESAYHMFLDHFWLGVGLDNFLYQYRGKYILPEAWQEPNLSHPHNIALDYLSRLGLLGLVSGVWLQVVFWRLTLRLYRRLTLAPAVLTDALPLCVGLMASMANFLAHGLVDNSFFLVDLAYTFVLTLAVAQWLNDKIFREPALPEV